MIKKQNRGRDIKADLVSRPNAISGKYNLFEIGLDLESITKIKDTQIFFLENLQMKADLVDKIITQVEEEGNNINDPIILKQINEQISSAGTPLYRSETIMTSAFVSLQLIIYYGIAVGIWGLIFDRFVIFIVCGVFVGLLISLLSVVPVILFQRTKEKVKDISFSVASIWGNLAIIIGIFGLIIFGIKLILNKF